MLERCPLVGDNMPVFIDEGTVPIFERHPLERKGDEISKAAFGQAVLHGHHAVVGGKTLEVYRFRAFSQKSISEFSGFRSGNRGGKENPYMGAMTGTGPLHQGINVVFPADLCQRTCFFLPEGIILFFFVIVEIKNKKITCIVWQQRVDAYHIAGVFLFTLQMGHEDRGGKGNVFFIPAVLAADLFS